MEIYFFVKKKDSLKIEKYLLENLQKKMEEEYKEIESDDGVIEPGELLELCDFRLKNNGGM